MRPPFKAPLIMQRRLSNSEPRYQPSFRCSCHLAWLQLFGRLGGSVKARSKEKLRQVRFNCCSIVLRIMNNTQIRWPAGFARLFQRALISISTRVIYCPELRLLIGNNPIRVRHSFVFPADRPWALIRDAAQFLWKNLTGLGSAYICSET
jgi:hypothetical protein